VVMARATIRDWSSVVNILKTKTKKGLFETEPIIGFEPFMECVARFNGPHDLLAFCIAYVEPLERQYALSIQYRLYELATKVAITLFDGKRAAELKHLLATEVEPSKAEALKKQLDDAFGAKSKKGK